MKKIILSLATIGIITGATLGITGAWWSRSAKSTNNTFTSGTMGLQLANSWSNGKLQDSVSGTWDKDNMVPDEFKNLMPLF